MASPSGVEPETRPSQGLMISYFTTGINLDAGPGIEPGTRAYETLEIPFLYPAIKLVDMSRVELPPCSV